MSQRLTFQVDDDFYARFLETKEKLGVQTNREVMEHAFMMLEEALAAIERDQYPGAVDKNKQSYEAFRVPRFEGYRAYLRERGELPSHTTD